MRSYWNLMHIHYLLFLKPDLLTVHNASSLVKVTMGLQYDILAYNAFILFSASISHGGICITSHYFLAYTTIHLYLSMACLIHEPILFKGNAKPSLSHS